MKTAVNDGQVSVDRLNQMVERILASWYRLGQDTVRLLTLAPYLDEPLTNLLLR